MNGEQLRRAVARDTPAWTEQPAPAGDDELHADEALRLARNPAAGLVSRVLADEVDQLRTQLGRAQALSSADPAAIRELRDQVEIERARADQAMRAADQYYADLRAARAEVEHRRAEALHYDELAGDVLADRDRLRAEVLALADKWDDIGALAPNRVRRLREAAGAGEEAP